MRSLALPKLATSRKQDDRDSRMNAATMPFHFTPGHSRNSSGTSSASTPVTPTFSTRSHVRGPSSSSSLASTPDSPTTVAKSALDDLVEEPAERDDSIDETGCFDNSTIGHTVIEPLCICDTPFCEHRQFNVSPSTIPSTPEWIPGDDKVTIGDIPAARFIMRQKSAEISGGKLSMRMSRGWPSISNRWRERKPTTSVSSQTVRSAPPSRASSARQGSVTQTLINHLGVYESTLLPATQSRAASHSGFTSVPTSPTEALDIADPGYDQDPIDRQEHARTPLLPPILPELQSHTGEEMQSPLQSPSVAAYSSTASLSSTPVSTPVTANIPTPPLSAKPSFTSIGRVRSNHGPHLASDIPPMSIAEESDYWADRLGHDNYDFKPEPYFPENCDRDSCNRLLDDWETGRRDYIRRAFVVSRHHGPTSRTYKLTEQKWSEIEAQWRSNWEQANAKAVANGAEPPPQRLGDAQPLSKMPSLVDPEQPDKFPEINETDIVGPMVQRVHVQRTPSKKSSFLKLLTFGSRH